MMDIQLVRLDWELECLVQDGIGRRKSNHCALDVEVRVP